MIPDGDHVLALEVCRCLGRAGFEVILVAENPSTLHLGTCHARRVVRVASGATRGLLRELVEAEKIDVLLPASVMGLEWVAEQRDRLPTELAVLRMSDWATINRADDKAELVSLAQRHQLPVPRSLVFDPMVHDGDRLDLSNLQYPLLVKPARGTRGEGIQRLENEADWRRFTAETKPGGRWVVQEFLEGLDVGCSVYCRDGDILAWTIQRDLRAGPAGAEETIGVEFIADEAVLEVVTRTMASLSFSGVAHCDLRYDLSGRVHLIEINPRFWGSLAASLAPGVNFAQLAVLDALGEPWSVPPFRSCRYYFIRHLFPRLRSPAMLWREWRLLMHSDFVTRLRDPKPDLRRLRMMLGDYCRRGPITTLIGRA